MDSWIRRVFVAGTSVSMALLMSGTAGAQTAPAAQNNAQAPQHTIQMVQVQAQLDKTIDTKKAKQGDPVTAKLQQNVQIPDAAALPKNTVLEGHVDQVQPSQNKSDSMVTVTFDKAKLKDGKELPIKATVLAVSEPVYAQQQAQGMAPTGGAPMPSSGASSGGAASGGGSGSGAAPAPAPQPMNVPDASQGPSQPTQNHGGVPDVMLKSDIHEHTSATFSSKGKNVHVPDGTQMNFALAVIPAGVAVQ
jgi:hypothetical protein